MRKILANIRNKPEEHRRRLAFVFSLFLTLFIFTGWLNSKGVFKTGTVANDTLAPKSTQTAQVLEASRAVSPIETSKRAASDTVLEIKKSIQKFSETVGDVLVPFVTGIEIYERK